MLGSRHRSEPDTGGVFLIQPCERPMIIVTSRPWRARVELICGLCRRGLTLTEAWLAFPAKAEGGGRLSAP
jgi:hypothetical protein